MKMSVTTKEQAADICWNAIKAEDPHVIPGFVMRQIELPDNPDLAATEETVLKIIEIAWKRGFQDALIAIESNALLKVPVENN